jgi:DNA-directed RNA polymerase specialized sigma24 family protein
MNIAPSEHELISAITLRDPAAAAALYDQYAATLYKIIYCTVRDKQTADAVLEETLAYILINCADCHQQDKRLLVWMAGIARQFAGKRLDGRK